MAQRKGTTKTAKRPRGNNAFTAEELADRKARYLVALEANAYNKREAIKSIGANYSDIVRWKNEDPEFAEDELSVLNRLVDQCLHVVVDNALSKKWGNLDSAKWLLERLRKKQFALRTELTGADGDLQTIHVTITKASESVRGETSRDRLPTE